MSATSGEARRRRSGALFNNRHFADVAAAALDASRDSSMFTTRMVASATGLADSVVRPVLHRLVDARVLTKLPRAGSGRSAQFYQVLETSNLEDIRDLANDPHAERALDKAQTEPDMPE